jgi:hypothetical protein
MCSVTAGHQQVPVQQLPGAKGARSRVPPARALTRPKPPTLSPFRTDSWLKTKRLSELDVEDLFNLKRRGFSDAEIGRATGALWWGEGGRVFKRPVLAPKLAAVCAIWARAVFIKGLG